MRSFRALIADDNIKRYNIKLEMDKMWLAFRLLYCSYEPKKLDTDNPKLIRKEPGLRL